MITVLISMVVGRQIQEHPPSNPDISVVLYVIIVFALCEFNLCSSFQKCIYHGNRELPCIASHLSICIAFLMFHK